VVRDYDQLSAGRQLQAATVFDLAGQADLYILVECSTTNPHCARSFASASPALLESLKRMCAAQLRSTVQPLNTSPGVKIEYQGLLRPHFYLREYRKSLRYFFMHFRNSSVLNPRDYVVGRRPNPPKGSPFMKISCHFWRLSCV